MVISKDHIKRVWQWGKLGGLFLLPFLLSSVSLNEWESKHTWCLFTNIFGIECYGCGITKAIIAAIQFDFLRAWDYNKLIVAVMPLMICLWIKETIKIRQLI